MVNITRWSNPQGQEGEPVDTGGTMRSNSVNSAETCPGIPVIGYNFPATVNLFPAPHEGKGHEKQGDLPIPQGCITHRERLSHDLPQLLALLLFSVVVVAASVVQRIEPVLEIAPDGVELPLELPLHWAELHLDILDRPQNRPVHILPDAFDVGPAGLHLEQLRQDLAPLPVTKGGGLVPDRLPGSPDSSDAACSQRCGPVDTLRQEMATRSVCGMQGDLNSANIMLQNTTSVARELGKYSFMMLLRSFLAQRQIPQHRSSTPSKPEPDTLGEGGGFQQPTATETRMHPLPICRLLVQGVRAVLSRSSSDGSG